MNFTQLSENRNKLLTLKRERIMSDISIYTETNNEDDDLIHDVIRPNSQYANMKNYSNSNSEKEMELKTELNGRVNNSNNSHNLQNKKLSFQTSRKNSKLSDTKLSCNCKNSQCLKFYCECFSTLLYCDPKVCSCQNCSNNSENEIKRTDAINSYFAKSPNSFKKVLSAQNSERTQMFDLNATFRGCTCKKSFCLKKYCECYQAGLKCGQHCKCHECKNTKDNLSNNPNSTAEILKHPIDKSACGIFSLLSNDEVKIPNKNVINQYEIKKEILVPYKIIINDYLVNKEYENDN